MLFSPATQGFVLRNIADSYFGFYYFSGNSGRRARA